MIRCTQSSPRPLIFVLGLAPFLILPAPASAGLVINSQFNPSTPPSNMVGGGNLVDIFNTAVSFWENAFQDPNDNWVLNLHYQWAALGGQAGVFNLDAQGGSPHRIISGLILFNNSSTVTFFADPTPRDNSEYTQYHESSWATPEGPLNTGRQYAGATGDAAVGIDLLTIAEHEIGHALGLVASNTVSPDEIDVTPPRPFAGLMIPTKGRDHLMNLEASVMGQDIFGSGHRTLISGVDVLAEAQISQFDHPNLNPFATVPEPGTFALLLGGLAGVLSFVGAARLRPARCP